MIGLYFLRIIKIYPLGIDFNTKLIGFQQFSPEFGGKGINIFRLTMPKRTKMIW